MIKRVFALVAIGFLAICGASTIEPAGADFEQQGSYGGVSTGTANAQVISLANVAAMSQLRGVTITFTVGTGLTNTGPATIGVNTLSSVAVDRMNSGTLMPLGGSEMPAGKMVEAFFDGTELVLKTDYTGGDPVGSSKIINYQTADPGYVLEIGQCLSQTAEPALFAKYGTQYNTQDACTSGQFGVDNKKGRELAAADSMGGSAQNILTLCSSTIGATCGVQSNVVAQSNLASFTMGGSGSGSGSGSISGSASGSITVNGSANAGLTVNGNAAGSDLTCCLITGAASPLGVTASGSATWGVSGSASVNVSTSDTINSGGGNSPLSLVQPTKIVYFEAKL